VIPPPDHSALARDGTVAILTPTGRDGLLAKDVLARASVESSVCRDITGLCDAIRAGVGAVMIAEEALSPDARALLADALDGQPPWSDVSVIVLTSEGELSSGVSPAVRSLAGLANVTFLERPVRVATLVTVLSSALRARHRQYDIRDHLAERGAAEQTLRDSEGRLRAAVESAPYPMMLYTDTGAVLQLSRAWTAITGYDARELQTTDAWMALAYPAGSADGAAPPSSIDLLASGERSVRTRHGGTRTWDFHAVVLGAAPGGAKLWLTAAVDVTEFQSLLASERASREAAEAANRAKSDFLAVMSHELRTPLNAIAGYCDIMELGVYGPITDAQRDAIARIKLSEVRLLSLINDVLNLAKIESGRVQLNLAPVDMCAIARSMEAMIAPQLQKKGQTYESAFACDKALALADPEKAGQVVLNLLSNAVKFTGEGGRVRVEVEAHGSSIVTRISDNGPGIAADKHEAIFEPFVQVGRTTSAPAEGTGLGLSISRDLARLMGGDLTVQSPASGGTIFTFRLPASTG
jgi:PAS domain S-box-containing protein